MPIRLFTGPNDLQHYDEWLLAHASRSLWQSREWATFQGGLGRDVRIYVTEEAHCITASALICIDRTAGGLSTWDIPRGPIWNDAADAATLLEKMVGDAKAAGALSLTYSPLQVLPTNPSGSKPSGRLVQPEATRIIPLAGAEDDILAQMKPKGRYNLRLAEKHGIRVEESRDAPAFSLLEQQTGQRDKFTVHSEQHYRAFLDHLPGSFLLLAHHASSSTPIAGLMGVTWHGQSIYYYGASDHRHRQLMAPYLLQWHAMRHCKARGCLSYDLFGIAPPQAEDHPWSGISDFKAKFGGEVVMYPAERQVMLRPALYRMLRLKRKLMG